MTAVVAGGRGRLVTGSGLVEPSASMDWRSWVEGPARVVPRTPLNGAFGVGLLAGRWSKGPRVGAGGTGTDAAEAVEAGVRVNGVRDGHPESRRNAGADEEIRNVVDAVAGGQIGSGEEVGLAEGQQISPQFLIRQANFSEE